MANTQGEGPGPGPGPSHKVSESDASSIGYGGAGLASTLSINLAAVCFVVESTTEVFGVIAHPLDRFLELGFLRNDEGANTKRHVVGQLWTRDLSNATLLGTVTLLLWSNRAFESRSGGCAMTPMITTGSRWMLLYCKSMYRVARPWAPLL